MSINDAQSSNTQANNTSSDDINVSEMLVHIAGDLLTFANSQQELQSRLDIVRTAWNMSLNTRNDRRLELKRFIRKQKGVAPSKEALKGLESELKRIMKEKVSAYPDIDREIVKAEAIEKENGDYEIKAYFEELKEVPADQVDTQFLDIDINQMLKDGRNSEVEQILSAGQNGDINQMLNTGNSTNARQDKVKYTFTRHNKS